MATATLVCRVCGKEYEACRNAKRVDGVFRWQDVACSAEHGAVYLDLIRKSRAKNRNAVADNSENEAFALFDAEYTDEPDDDMEFDDFEDDSEDSEELEIEV